MRKLSRIFGAIGAALALAIPAQAQSYPDKTITMVVPYAAGGPTDVYARFIADSLSNTLGQSVIVDNKPGGATIIGAEAVAGAPNDGYTLLFTVATTISSNPHLYSSLPYKPDDFAPISLMATSPFVLAVGPTVTAPDAQAFVELAKSETIAVGSLGLGTAGQLLAATFEREANVDLNEITYKGSSAAMTDLVAGRIGVYFDGPASAVPQHNAQKIRILAVTSDERLDILPETPTMNELGYSGMTVSTWWGLFAPAGTSAEIVDKLNAAMVKAVDDPKLLDRLKADGVQPRTSTPVEFAEFIKNDLEYWRNIIEPLGIQLQQ